MPDLHGWITQQIDGAFMQALHQAVDETVTGNGTGELLGFLGPALREPTPGERAFAILAPHLAYAPLYRPKYPLGGVLPNGVGATADRPPALRGPNWKARP